MGGHARPYSKHGRAMPVHNSNFDFYAYIYSEQTKVFQHHKTHRVLIVSFIV